MSTLNSLIVEGNIVRSPVLRTTPKGTPVCTFSIASNRFYRYNDETNKETSFFDIESWSKLAQSCGEQCKKGRGVRVVGRLKQDRWVGADGKNYSKIKVVAEHVEFKPQFNEKTQKAASAELKSESPAETEAIPTF